MSLLSTVPSTKLSVRPWPDPVIDQVGHDPRSPYVEQFWLGVLGPTATWLLRRLVGGLETTPAGFDLDLEATAAELGLGTHTGPHSPFIRSIRRCCRFGASELIDDDTLRVRRKLPPLTRVQVERLPDGLRASHDDWVADHAPGTSLAVDQLRQRARHLALSLLELGEDGEGTERQLHRWRIHPAMAHDATAWAVARHRAAHDAVATPRSSSAC
ncbi:MAG: hypothetical protein WD691_12495 [Acidimicrobiales bacterium]